MKAVAVLQAVASQKVVDMTGYPGALGVGREGSE